MKEIRLVSSDLNGTLVHQHTMSDMIKVYLGDKRFIQANEVFKRQTEGRASMQEAFETAGPLTKGLTLGQAIEYTKTHMRYLNGFSEFIDSLHSGQIPFVINSTGYSVTIYAMRAQLGKGRIHGYIGNKLKFGVNGDEKETLTEKELEELVEKFILEPGQRRNNTYTDIKATGVVELGISDEAAKAKLILEYRNKKFNSIQDSEIAHIGDTIGDSLGILEIARLGGLGIAFNYNGTLESFLKERIRQEKPLKKRVVFIDKKSENSDLRKIIQELSRF